MEFKQIEYFLQLARFEHVSQAADFLGVTQPTLSKSLRLLEQDLGVPLFDRVGNRIRLNAAGRAFYDYAQKALQNLQAGSLTARRTLYETAGTISIACLTFAPILMPCIADYSLLNPLTNLELLQYNHNLSHISATDNYDFILASAQDKITEEQNRQFWVSQPLFSESFYLVIGPKHARFRDLPETDGEEIDLAPFSEERFVTMNLENNFIDLTYHVCQRAGFFPHSRFQTDDFLIKMHAVRDGMAIAFLPDACLEDARLLCPGLRHFRVSDYASRRTVTLLRKKKRLLSETALDFYEFVLEFFNLPADTRE
ncbi:MAG: LysR family transcriptional regulator [Lachnospiraceae bacterium]|nr:LysR family transcriptional regulator [Lachnospiraceae bacterium]